MTEEHDSRFYVAASTLRGAGQGLFAKAALAKGEMLEVVGILIPADSVSDRCTSYADVYKFRVGADLLIPTGYGGLANHSASPNMEKIITGKQVYLRALRPIEQDEELLYLYSRYARGQFAEGADKTDRPDPGEGP
jgi:hypothetical protein